MNIDSFTLPVYKGTNMYLSDNFMEYFAWTSKLASKPTPLNYKLLAKFLQ